MSRRRRNGAPAPGGDAPLWYKDAIVYEVPVRAFRDSNGDGGGDFRGLVEKLDYLHDLGVTALWLLPFYPSPLRDDGYDIADYTNVHPRYGTLADFKLFLREAHRRGLRVITELVVNHTSDQHPWFQRARRAPPGSPERDFYVWSDSPERFKEARIIFKDFETSNWTWDPIAGAYYWHRFYSHQPDLNYDNRGVWEAVFQVLDFWLGLGVDAFRLDAVPYLYEREGTNCENLPETHEFLKALRRHVDEKFQGRMLLAEANQWPEDSVAYFGQGDECHMAFHFPVMPRLFMAIQMEDRLPILDILAQTPAIPDSCQWALFLRNHDELTLEMVTDEDRDYMYRAYARDPQARINLGIRRRLAPLLENHRAKIELMNGLLLSLPGTPVLYYGDEIGMGDNIYLGDRNGVRTPMQWTAERNAGFSRANPQGLYLPVIIDPEYHYEAVNVEVQQNNPHSLLWWMKRLIDLRKHHPAFGRGSITFLTPSNHKVLAFVRSLTADAAGAGADDILVVANLSRLAQYVEVDLTPFQGRTPVELLGRTPFPPVGDRPYFLSLGPYQFYWFALERRQARVEEEVRVDHPTIEVGERWEGVLTGDAKDVLQEWLPAYLRSCPWFLDRPAQVEAAMILESIPLPYNHGVAHLALVQVEYSEGDAETVLLPLACAVGPQADRIAVERPHAIIARLRLRGRAKTGDRPGIAEGGQDGVLYDPVGEPSFAQALLETILRHRRFRRATGELLAQTLFDVTALERGAPGAEHPDPALGAPRSALPRSDATTAAAVQVADPGVVVLQQRNTSLRFGDRYILKLFRHLEEGTNPEVEVGRFLEEKTTFRNAPSLLGTLDYRRSWGEPLTLAVLHRAVPQTRDVWSHAQDVLGRYFEHALAQRPAEGTPLPPAGRPLLELTEGEVPALAQQLIGPVLEAARLLGQRGGEMHLALASRPDDPAFAPEPFTGLYQRSLYQSLRSQVRQTFVQLRQQLASLPEAVRPDASQVEGLEESLLQRARRVHQRKITAQRIRNHGDFNLREVLYDGRDFVIIDFEGIPSRPVSSRRRKYTALRDVAAMLRSFHYAVLCALYEGSVRAEDRPALMPWAQVWVDWVSVAFLRGYLVGVGPGAFLPPSREEQQVLLDFYLFKRSLYELRSELTRSSWRVLIPLRGLLHLLETGPSESASPSPVERGT